MQRTLCNIAKKLFLVLVFIVLLTSCSKQEAQFFIFKRYDSKTDRWKYYKTNLYAPSRVEEINTIPCSDDKRVQPVWSPDGKYYGCGAVYDQPLLIRDVHNTITAKLDQGNLKDPILWNIKGWSPDSQYVSIMNTGSKGKPYYDFSIMKYDGTQLRQIFKLSRAAIDVGEWSPNGKYILVEEVDKQCSFIIFNTSGTEIARFDLSKLVNSLMVDPKNTKWSPDSKKLAFGVYDNRDVSSKLFVLDIGSGKITDITPDEPICIITIFDWSPDSKDLLFDAIMCKEHVSGDFSGRISYSIHVDGSNLKALTGKGNGSLHWALDGKSIIMDGYEGKDIYLMDIDGNNKKKLVAVGDYTYFVSWIRP